jgi:D-lyxose ketol-isomerase
VNGGGDYAVSIIADLNNQVAEGAGENNNGAFTFNYRVDQALVARGSITLNNGDTLTLTDGVQVSWNGEDIVAIDGQVGKVNDSYDSIDEDDIDNDNADEDSVEVDVGDVVVIRTNGGKKGALRVDDIDNGDDTVTLSYKAF